MLRITRTTGAAGHILKVEGKLLGPWVGELENACKAGPDTVSEARLDLSAVSYVDAAGVKLLRELLAGGARIEACSGLVAELLHREERR